MNLYEPYMEMVKRLKESQEKLLAAGVSVSRTQTILGIPVILDPEQPKDTIRLVSIAPTIKGMRYHRDD